MRANFDPSPFKRPFDREKCNLTPPRVTRGEGEWRHVWFARDDDLVGGTKSRFLVALIDALGCEAEQPLVYAGPAQGGLQVAMAAAFGPRAHLFFSERKKKGLHPRQNQSLALGATHHYSPFPNVRPTQVAGMARRWAEEHDALNLRWSLSYPSVINALSSVVRAMLLQEGLFNEIWVAGGGGTLAHGILQGALGFPIRPAVHVVPIGRQMEQKEVPGCVLHRSPHYTMDQRADGTLPPFVCPYYDGKALLSIPGWADYSDGPKRLFWNVIAPAPEE